MFSRVQKGIVALAVLGAIAVGASAIAGAASNNGSSGASGATGTQAPQGGQRPDPAQMSHGPGETLLTDGTASKVRQAALDKVPGATVIRVETDSDGSPYEAHLQKSDGSEVTVKVDKNYSVTAVDNGFGGGPGGSHP
jgi:hypothetical protein